MSEKEKVQQQFGKNASHYVTSKSHAKGFDLAKLVEIVTGYGAFSGELLDIATGGGHVANAFAPSFQKVTALDLTEDMLHEAEQFIRLNGHENVVFIQGDAEKTPFPNESFEVVTCRIAAHHFPDVDRFISEVFRVLNPGGLFVLVDTVAPEKDEYDQFYNTIEKKRDPSHFRAYKKSEWISKIENAGLYMENMFTFSKKFTYETWCTMMDLPAREKNELSTYMNAAPKRTHNHFSIEFSGDEVQSFKGQSILLAAIKK
ncbi:class I SAM-dependent methyltransferase [Mesobacillus subterraneus]|uniref:class I SAM-dependent methyltransferase n=1 Tax=Mesobacillus subterraneus TaxID=285983 RepID=UPI00203D13F0|nr:class I SAM-dependent methyltransferase [Mesobacillus subterraneus]MCM3664159.1 class I SAM-dependent methyltransferase [Mesobacillus subterraneus]MCM3682187.1 class I SAM-dependent methyltransferase [Mesobacillus subterraneus]